MAQHIYPGGRLAGASGFVDSIDDAAVADSMAEAIEEEMSRLYQSIKKMPLPATGGDDRRILFVAIARGVLRHLKEAQTDNIATQPAGPVPSLKVTIAIDLDSAH